MWRSFRTSATVAAMVVAMALAVLFWRGEAVRACGPSFPNRLLISAESTLLSSPIAIFAAELERILPDEAARFRANPPEKGDYVRQTVQADVADLQAALSESGVGEAEGATIVGPYRLFRERLAAWAKWKRTRHPAGEKPDVPAPSPDEPLAIPGLPREFALYVRGAVFYHSEDMERARAEWEKLLGLPEGERKCRSVWAAYMTGRSFRGRGTPRSTLPWYRRTRELVSQGYADSLGLAAASYGWEARAELHLQNYVRAIHLYLEQYRTGDRTAYASLRAAAAGALSSDKPEALAEVATDPLARDVVTAFVISGYRPFWRRAQFNERAKRWLDAMEEMGAEEVNSAERLGMIAYQTGEIAIAERWLERAPEDSPVANWLKSKLLSRAGKMDEAAALLARACREFPEVEKWYFDADEHCVYYRHTRTPMPKAAFGELGVLQLSRRKYVDALDALLRGRYWLDAAFVAERVLTAEELKAYVDRRYPKDVPIRAGSPTSPPEAVRYLLARRLARMGRLEEGRPYYPRVTYQWKPEYPGEKLLPHFDRYVRALEIARDEKRAPPQRADAFWTAAQIMREKGIELFGTEVEPDWWALYRGNYRMSSTPEHRKSQEEVEVGGRSEDERERVSRNAPSPDKRWHYRYAAADLAWQAAELMPDGTDRKAAVLCNAGMWLARRDPGAADRFYKALVETCGSTPRGMAAAQARWFLGLGVRGANRKVDLPPLREGGETERPGLPIENARMVIRKQKRTLELYSGDKLVRSCRIGLGPTPTGDKEREGDGRTPEGKYYVCVKNPQSRYFLSLGLSYPNEEDAKRGLNAGRISRKEHDAVVAALREHRIPPWRTALGGEIYIHGRGATRDWTQGCIALGDADMLLIFAAVPRLTLVEIVP